MREEILGEMSTTNYFALTLRLANFSTMMKVVNKTTTLNAQVAVSKTEKGMDCVQVLPDDPSIGLVESFRGYGYGQMLSSGTFEFERVKRKRGKPELKVGYGGLSFCTDDFDRVIFTVPSELRYNLPEILKKGTAQIIKYLRENHYSL